MNNNDNKYSVEKVAAVYIFSFPIKINKDVTNNIALEARPLITRTINSVLINLFTILIFFVCLMAIIILATAIKIPNIVQSIEKIAVTVSVETFDVEKKYNKGVKANAQKQVVKILRTKTRVLNHFLVEMDSLVLFLERLCSFSIELLYL